MSPTTNVLILIAALATLQGIRANTIRTCHTCEGINCERTTLDVAQKCVDPLDYCVTIFEKFTVVRKGCSSEIPIELRRRCDMNSVECHKCYTDRCNSLGQADFMCLQCDSSKDSNCARNAQTIEPTRCGVPTAPNSYCYVKYENNVTKRGCAVAVTEQEQCYMDANCLLCMPGDIRGCNVIDFMPGTRAYKL